VNPLLRPLYGAAGLAARAAAAVAPAGGGKIRRALHARRGARARLVAWAAAHRDPARALLWMHAPSVGEGLQARPVLELARRERPDLQIVYTHFSPSAAALATGFVRDGLADVAEYLPFDTGADADALLAALAPRALVFSKLDVWPVLAARAARAGVRLGLVSATLAEGSSRRGALAGALLGDAYAALDAVGAIDPADADRLVALGVRPDRVRVTGDTRYDQVWRRARAAELAGPPPAGLLPLRAGAGGRFTLVAGSTWPADERVLCEAWTALRFHDPRARLVLAPHEPTPAHLAPIERWAAGAGLGCARLSSLTGGAGAAERTDVVLVDTVGILADLYAAADVAFVGGGFHAAGLHSVLEPAAFGVPVCFGPRHANSRDAGLLVAAGGAVAVESAPALAARMREWKAHEPMRADAGTAARRLVQRALGADVRAWALVAGLL
jgi:3-deoxy-D-manno-octulosonic-acid transferase